MVTPPDPSEVPESSDPSQPAAMAAATAVHDWTCPFCPLLCDDLSIQVDARGALGHVEGESCPRLAHALSAFAPAADGAAIATASIDGQPADIDTALSRAAALLADARAPLFGGLATDVAGARALYTLAAYSGAIVDHLHGDTLTQNTLALQDRGSFFTTLSEVRTRADLVIVVGSRPGERYPAFYRRTAIGGGATGATGATGGHTAAEAHTPAEKRAATDAGTDGPVPSLAHAAPLKRELVFIASPVDPAILDAANLSTTALLPNADPDDLYDILAILSALLEGRTAAHLHGPVKGGSNVPTNDYGDAAAALAKLVEKIASATYTVFVCEPALLPGPHAALLIEALQRIAKTVNRTTRAGCLLLGGDDGALSVNQTITWLSGLPPRTRVGGAAARGAVALDYDPHRYRTARLLADREVDLLLWIATFGPQPLPAEVPGDMPVIVFGHPANAHAMGARTAPTVFVPVATPGIDLRGHLFRTDVTMLVPLKPARPAALPALDTLLARLAHQVAGTPTEKP